MLIQLLLLLCMAHLSPLYCMNISNLINQEEDDIFQGLHPIVNLIDLENDEFTYGIQPVTPKIEKMEQPEESQPCQKNLIQKELDTDDESLTDNESLTQQKVKHRNTRNKFIQIGSRQKKVCKVENKEGTFLKVSSAKTQKCYSVDRLKIQKRAALDNKPHLYRHIKPLSEVWHAICEGKAKKPHEELIFRNPDDYKKHLSECNNKRFKKEFPEECKHCNNRFTTPQYLTRHERIFKRKKMCPQRSPLPLYKQCNIELD